MPTPNFFSVQNNTVLLVDLSLKPETANALNKLLLTMAEQERDDMSSYLGSFRTSELVLDSSMHTDEALAALLSNLSKHRTIENVSIANCRLGPKSIKCLIELATKITQLRLLNIPNISPVQSNYLC